MAEGGAGKHRSRLPPAGSLNVLDPFDLIGRQLKVGWFHGHKRAGVFGLARDVDVVNAQIWQGGGGRCMRIWWRKGGGGAMTWNLRSHAMATVISKVRFMSLGGVTRGKQGHRVNQCTVCAAQGQPFQSGLWLLRKKGERIRRPVQIAVHRVFMPNLELVGRGMQVVKVNRINDL